MALGSIPAFCISNSTRTASTGWSITDSVNPDFRQDFSQWRWLVTTPRCRASAEGLEWLGLGVMEKRGKLTQIAGSSNYLQAPSLSCFMPGIDYSKTRFIKGYWPETLHMASLCDLGFSKHRGVWVLSRSFLRGSFWKTTAPREPTEAAWLFYDLASEVIWLHISHPLLVKWVINLPDSRGEDIGPIFQWEDCQRFIVIFFN